MANYYATARSNYFKVKDEKAFTEEMGKLNIEVHDYGDGVAMFCQDPDGGGWPTCIFDDEANDYVEVDLSSVVGEHLADGEVCILMEVGNEKARYVIGTATAIRRTAKGEIEEIHLSLDHIYHLVREQWGVEPTQASY